MLMGRVARMYYELGLTHQEIADSLGLSRVRVTRLLADARAAGIVEITVHADAPLFDDLERALTERFALDGAWVAPSIDDPTKAERAFARTGVDAVSALVTPDPTVAFTLSTAVALIASSLPRATAATSTGGRYVPLTGSPAGRASDANPHELARHFAEAFGGRAFHLPAPLVAASPDAARILDADPGVTEILDLAAEADLVVTGIGNLDHDGGVLLRSLPPKTADELRAAGAVGDIAGRFFGPDGAPVDHPLDARIIGLDTERFHRIPKRLAVARGTSKVEALRTALTAGLVTHVATDVATTHALLRD